MTALAATQAIQGLRATQDEAFHALALLIRENVLVPWCSRHKVRFYSGMGIFGFEDRNGIGSEDWCSPAAYNPEFAPVPWPEGYPAIRDMLDQECAYAGGWRDVGRVGHLIEDVRFEDLDIKNKAKDEDDE